MSRSIFRIPRTSLPSTPNAGLTVYLQKFPESEHISGAVTIEFSKESLVDFAKGLASWAVLPLDFKNSSELMEPISKKVGAVANCGVFVHPDSLPLYIIPERFDEDPAIEFVGPDKDFYKLDFSDFERGLIRVSAVLLNGRSHNDSVALDLTHYGMITFAADLLRWSESESFGVGSSIALKPGVANGTNGKVETLLSDKGVSLTLCIVEMEPLAAILKRIYK